MKSSSVQQNTPRALIISRDYANATDPRGGSRAVESTQDDSGQDGEPSGRRGDLASPTRSISFLDDFGKLGAEASATQTPSSAAEPRSQQLLRNRKALRRIQEDKIGREACCCNCGGHSPPSYRDRTRRRRRKVASAHDESAMSDEENQSDDAAMTDDGGITEDDDSEEKDENEDDISGGNNDEDDEVINEKRIVSDAKRHKLPADKIDGSAESAQVSAEKESISNRPQDRTTENDKKDTEKGEEQQRQEQRLSQLVYRRLPVFTGVIAPFSIMLEIPGLTSKWYVRLGEDHTVNPYRDNPAILDVGLALSFASAVIANIAILGRFAEKMQPRRATLTAIASLLIHDIINIVALIVFGVVHNVDDGFTYSEAYWMTTGSTGASLLCTTTLLIDFFRTKNFKNAGSGLTRKQSQLVIVVMAFLTYISISALIFALSMPLQFLDAMYFMVETQATVGLGDITPNSTGTRVAFFVITPGGIILLAMVVAFARLTILEELEDAYKRRREKFRKRAEEGKREMRDYRKVHRTLLQRMRRRSTADNDCTGEEGQEERGHEGPTTRKAGLGRRLKRTLSVSTATSVPRSPTLSSVDSTKALSSKQNEVSTGTENALAAETEVMQTTVPAVQTRLQRSHDRESSRPEPLTPSAALDKENLAFSHAMQLYRTLSTVSTGEAASQLQQIEAILAAQRDGFNRGLEDLGKDLANEQRIEFALKLAGSFALFVVFWTIGALIFSQIEGWSYFDGIYFVYVVFTSIGFGDFAPKSSGGRAFFIVWALFGFGALTVLFSIISDSWSNTLQQRKLASGKLKKRRKQRMRRTMRRVKSAVSLRSWGSRRSNSESGTSASSIDDDMRPVDGVAGVAATTSDASESSSSQSRAPASDYEPAPGPTK